MGNQIRIVVAQPRHVIAIYNLLKKVYEEIPGFPVLEEGPSIQCILNTIATGYCLMAILDGKVIGSIGITPEKFIWSPSVSFGRTFWWSVAKEHRKTKAAMMLMKRAKEDCEKEGGTLIVDQITAYRPEAFGKAMKRMGAEYLGGAFMFGSLRRG